MKRNQLLPLIILTSLIGFSGCSQEEKALEKASEAEAPVVELPPEPELQPIQNLGTPAEKPATFNTTQKTNSPIYSGQEGPQNHGFYVIQVDIKPSKRSAQKVIDQLSAQGIDAYITEVENPGELEGTYYRVRIGYFSTIKQATAYAQNTLAPAGYAWWIDNKSNDAVGQPKTTESEYQDDYSNYPVEEPPARSDWQAEPEPVQQPTPEPKPMPEPQPVEPAPAVQQQPAAAPAPAATPAPEPQVDDRGNQQQTNTPPPPPPPAPAAEAPPAGNQPSEDGWGQPAAAPETPPAAPPAPAPSAEDTDWE